MYKTKLQQLFQQNQWQEPVYSISKEGPGHNLRFFATVTANGECFQSNPCRTSRGAQNSAAEVALGHFFSSNPLQDLQNENAPVSDPLLSVLPASHNVGLEGKLTSQSHTISQSQLRLTCVEVNDHENSLVLPALHNDGLEANLTLQSHSINESQRPLAHLELTDHKNSLDGGQWYKNRLQNYLQKRNLRFPEYSFESQGPPHASYFKCKVTVCGQSYQSNEFFLSMRDAENAAAKIAYEQISVNEDQKGDFGLYKNALQELAHKRGFLSPSYKTESCGPGHSLTFLSTVIVDDKIYLGIAAKSKKQAEVNAAKSAYDSLQGINLGTHLEDPCVSNEIKEVVMFDSTTKNVLNGSINASPMLEQEDIRDGKRPRSFMSC
ncbi:uncharacterized protein LOC124942067 [Impatiens glandulifera]|uniref:uncharacterized protein LOC124942067 n=1 Tax=Impatiens glandulifera TaxID=253017 RepID=UPI001FB0886A|nr:uncharacterized protein LOC124942067 [Impatiens glandulifera]XP_047338433.1 uncharacterized protein LOC124942067 [Impatiens glandulifera]